MTDSTTETVAPKGRRTMSIAELAEATGLCQNTLYTLAQRGQLPGTLRFGKRWMFSRAAVSEALDRGWVPGDSAGASS